MRCISTPGTFSYLHWLSQRQIELDKLNFNSPSEVVFIKAWEQTSITLGRPDHKAECVFMPSFFKCSSSTMNLGVLNVIAGTSVGAGGVCSFFSDRWMEIH